MGFVHVSPSQRASDLKPQATLRKGGRLQLNATLVNEWTDATALNVFFDQETAQVKLEPTHEGPHAFTLGRNDRGDVVVNVRVLVQVLEEDKTIRSGLGSRLVSAHREGDALIVDLSERGMKKG